MQQLRLDFSKNAIHYDNNLNLGLIILTRSIELIYEIVGLRIVPLGKIHITEEVAYDENP